MARPGRQTDSAVSSMTVTRIADNIVSHSHRRRSDWNSGGDKWRNFKSLAVEAIKHISLHCNASNPVLKILQRDRIWGTVPRSKFWGGDLSPRIYAHAHSAWQWHPETAARGDREKV